MVSQACSVQYCGKCSLFTQDDRVCRTLTVTMQTQYCVALSNFELLCRHTANYAWQPVCVLLVAVI